MKTSTILITAALLIAAVFASGCVQLPGGSSKGTETQQVVNQEEAYGVADPTAHAQEAECTAHVDCYDENACTSDACTNGVCSHTFEADCEAKDVSAPRISAVFLGDKEWIQITAKNYRVDGWRIENQNGAEYHKFKAYTTINNYAKIYSGNGFSTTTEWYMSKGDFWSPGDKVVLKDDKGNVVSEMQG